MSEPAGAWGSPWTFPCPRAGRWPGEVERGDHRAVHSAVLGGECRAQSSQRPALYWDDSSLATWAEAREFLPAGGGTGGNFFSPQSPARSCGLGQGWGPQRTASGALEEQGSYDAHGCDEGELVSPNPLQKQLRFPHLVEVVRPPCAWGW